MLLDSASLYFRAFFGVPDQRTSEDEPPTNALRGFLDMIATLVTAHRPTHLVACWDDDWRPQWRVDLVPTYKTHRLTEGSDVVEESPDDLTPQVPLIREALAAVGIPRLGAGLRGRRRHRHAGRGTRGHGRRRRHRRPRPAPARRRRGIRVLYTGGRGARARHRDPGAAREKYAVATGEAYLEMSVLRGDTSDGLPGVKGIGDKTAAELIEIRLAGRAARGRRGRRPRDQGRPAHQPRGGGRLPRRGPDGRAGGARRAGRRTSTWRCPARWPTRPCSRRWRRRTA